ncbi:GNAT family N-acetyltransferase [Simiduia curdlanivorans]|uniref:GNAT family N-acetyltransferase n=1 Tax=Simiduia curdlanivorans TaxID=1492769 RepID=A0ABV8V772_9GAMM|nr:GNAT family N-acetyltransferase [Simiduia curdlanivorans]MDN3637431.1 GNAT family N-acetyltransferase [Simiduia curdlanivorans]
MNPSQTTNCTIQRVDYADAEQMHHVLNLLDAYARDPMGGGEALADHVRAELPVLLRATQHAVSFIAFVDAEAVGLINGFETVSTFAAKRLINIHDLAVLSVARGKGVATQLMQAMEAHARARQCCKLTLEVLTGNQQAGALYAAMGYRQYELDPKMGQAVFLQKKL